MEMKAVPMYVQPAQTTPYEVIPLTQGSVMAGLNTLVSTHVLIFKPTQAEVDGVRPSDIIRSGLSQLLVPYYPLAGRIVENETGWEVQCDGQGAVFIVTTAPDFEETVVQGRPLESGIPDYMETVVLPAPDVTVQPPSSPLVESAHAHIPTLTVKITELETGGFVLAVKMYKGICDTAGLLHFLCGWAEMARGKPHISVFPLWGSRKMHGDSFSLPSCAVEYNEKFQSSLPLNYPSTGERPPYQVHVPSLEKSSQDSAMYGEGQGTSACHHHGRLYKVPMTEKVRVDIPFEVIHALLNSILVGENYTCTAAQVLTAHVWRERTRALQVPSDNETRLFFVSTSMGDHPKGFYGPFAFNCEAKANAGDLVDLPLVYAVQLVREAEENLAYNFATCTSDFKEVHCSCGYTPLEVLLFTRLPTANTETRLDFGALGRPLASSLDTISFPSKVNIAAVAPALDAYDSSFHIIMNNIPFVHITELRSFLCSMPTHISIDSKI